ncbi:unnamed protein product [Effrenium voratum]|nr:unnamed protein product [Effrenium voratum]
MGRRHFTFAAPPRAMQESMKQGCQVKIDDGQKPSSLVDSENILSRRHFAREVSGGGTPTCLEISSRRHFADIEHQESCPEANDCDIGKKHVRGRSAQLHGSVQVTGTETASGKRCDFSHRPQRRSGAPQRRHLQCKEHLLWSGAVAGQVDVPAQELHCCFAHRNHKRCCGKFENGLPATFLFWSRESQEEACCRGVKCGHTT